MSAVSVRGLAALKQRLEARELGASVKDGLRREGEAIAGEAARAAPGSLGATVEVRDASEREKIAFAVGTPEKHARFVEYGTIKRPPSPWLFPIFRARLPRIKQSLRNSLMSSFKRARREV